MRFKDAAIEANALQARAGLLAQRLTEQFAGDIGGIRIFGTADVMDRNEIEGVRCWPKDYKVVLALGWYNEDGSQSIAMPFEPSALDATEDKLREVARTIRYFHERAA